ncbi:MAG: twin-arginine translocase TatA/TatE family subunit [Alphaproteobacteria bacterium]|nr:twin-arginine translocase TatA/TatE family subunit [Alphaproteobacteria bacterium]
MSLSMTEIILILVVVLVLFGGKRIPELARGLGKAQAEYKKAKEAIENEVSEFKAEVEKSSKKENIKKTAPKKKKTQAAAKKTTSKTIKKTAVKSKK